MNTVKREYKTAQDVRNWIRYKWIPRFAPFVFKGEDAMEILESGISYVSTLKQPRPYDEECCIACFVRLSSKRRLDMCRRVLREMGYYPYKASKMGRPCVVRVVEEVPEEVESKLTFDRPGHAPGEE